MLDQTDVSTTEQSNHKYDLSVAADRRNHLFGVLVNPNEPAEYAHIELCDTVIVSLFGSRYKALSLPTGECLLCCENVFSRVTDEKMPKLNRLLLDGNGNGYGIIDQLRNGINGV